MSRCGCVGNPPPGRDAVVVDDPQRAELVVLRVVVIAERERVPAIEPAEIRDAALGSLSNRQHW